MRLIHTAWYSPLWPLGAERHAECRLAKSTGTGTEVHALVVQSVPFEHLVQICRMQNAVWYTPLSVVHMCTMCGTHLSVWYIYTPLSASLLPPPPPPPPAPPHKVLWCGTACPDVWCRSTLSTLSPNTRKSAQECSQSRISIYFFYESIPGSPRCVCQSHWFVIKSIQLQTVIVTWWIHRWISQWSIAWIILDGAMMTFQSMPKWFPSCLMQVEVFLQLVLIEYMQLSKIIWW